MTRKNSAPTGILYAKYHNWKNNLKRDMPQKSAKNPKSITFEVDVSEEEHIRALKHDMPTMPINDIVMHWSGCAASRINAIRSDASSSKQVLDVWPQYKLPYGYRLVCELIISLSFSFFL